MTESRRVRVALAQLIETCAAELKAGPPETVAAVQPIHLVLAENGQTVRSIAFGGLPVCIAQPGARLSVPPARAHLHVDPMATRSNAAPAMFKLYRRQGGRLGLGHCDGGAIGFGAMEAFCMVVDAKSAQLALAAALKTSPFQDFTVRRMPG